MDEDQIFHDKAVALKPNMPIPPKRYWVGVLYHNISPAEANDESQFLWIKANSKITIETIRNEYMKKQPLPIVLKLGSHFPALKSKMSDINYFGDNTIILRAIEEASLEARYHSAVRRPLQPVDAQLPRLPITAPHVIQKPIKSPLPGYAPSHRDTPILPPLTNGHQSSFSGLRKPMSVSSPMPIPTPIHPPISVPTPSQERIKIEQLLSNPGRQLVPANRPAPPVVAEPPTAPAIRRWLDEPVNLAPAAVAPAGPSGAPRVPEPEIIPLNVNLQKLITGESSPEFLEDGVKVGLRMLEDLQNSLVPLRQASPEATHWVTQIQGLMGQSIRTRTVIGVVGNTGGGKSSVINALLDEEQLVATNCMRACTAVVTEISWNDVEDEDRKYRAEIEFIKTSDWERELDILFKDLLDSNGEVSRDISTQDSEAAVAYAKIKAVYPDYTKDMLAQTSPAILMNKLLRMDLLGKTQHVQEASAERFAWKLKRFVDSKEKQTGPGSKKDAANKEMEFWPLIKVVKIYTRSEALSTGAVIVDLPGVHDSNAARAAVAAGYMKQCTGLWVVAPINRAVDDKAAKTLLGESFKRQLKYDGTYGNVTFICSKTDDISITEASDSLGITDEMNDWWSQLDDIEKRKTKIEEDVTNLKEEKAAILDVVNDTEEQMVTWEKLQDSIEDGETVYAPSEKSKKRKRRRSSDSPPPRRKRREREDSLDNFIVDSDDDASNATEKEDNCDEEGSTSEGDPLTIEQVREKISQLREDKKQARKGRSEIDEKLKALRVELKELAAKQHEVDSLISARCIAGRNEYSKGAIRQDFAAGIRELDMENAAEDDEANFNPDEDLRDYDEVARSLPVFCVSSRAYQKLSGRLVKEKPVPGFTTEEETGMPQLKAHCKKLTVAGRVAGCRRFLNGLSQLINSLNLWANTKGGLALSEGQKATEGDFLRAQLGLLQQALGRAVNRSIQEIKGTLEENIFNRFENAVKLAVDAAIPTVQKWGAPVNRTDRAAGGLFWGTYKAVCRREGVFASPSAGTLDFNQQLTDPLMKQLAGGWERAFARKLPQVLEPFAVEAVSSLRAFHRIVEERTRQHGAGAAGIAALAHQLTNYEAYFQDLINHLKELINACQRDANREFTPVIGNNMVEAYNRCASESGTGSYARMKSHMQSHVNETRLGMFSVATEEVRNRLMTMCQQVERDMAERTGGVFREMHRDYMTAIGVEGYKAEIGGGVPEWYLGMKRDVSNILKGGELAYGTLIGIEHDGEGDAEQAPEDMDGVEHEFDDRMEEFALPVDNYMPDVGDAVAARPDEVVKVEDYLGGHGHDLEHVDQAGEKASTEDIHASNGHGPLEHHVMEDTTTNTGISGPGDNEHYQERELGHIGENSNSPPGVETSRNQVSDFAGGSNDAATTPILSPAEVDAMLDQVSQDANGNHTFDPNIGYEDFVRQNSRSVSPGAAEASTQDNTRDDRNFGPVEENLGPVNGDRADFEEPNGGVPLPNEVPPEGIARSVESDQDEPMGAVNSSDHEQEDQTNDAKGEYSASNGITNRHNSSLLAPSEADYHHDDIQFDGQANSSTNISTNISSASKSVSPDPEFTDAHEATPTPSETQADDGSLNAVTPEKTKGAHQEPPLETPSKQYFKRLFGFSKPQ